jgi:hypothetical protein
VKAGEPAGRFIPGQKRWSFLCTVLVRRCHPEAAARVQPAIDACSDVVRLHTWMFKAHESPPDRLHRIFGLPPFRLSRSQRKHPAPRPTQRPRASPAPPRAAGPGGRRVAGPRYTEEQLARIIPEEGILGSTLYETVRSTAHDIGYKQGFKKGRLDEARALCMSFLTSYHPGVAKRVQPAIETCTDLRRLRRWTMRAPQTLLSDDLERMIERDAALRVRRGARRR